MIEEKKELTEQEQSNLDSLIHHTMLGVIKRILPDIEEKELKK